MTGLLDRLSSEARKKLRKVSMPDWIDPMLATLTDRRFSDENWIFERKLDGERCLTFRDGGNVRLLSRNKQVLNAAYPELVAYFGKQIPDQFIADGDVVAFEGSVSSFERLQDRMHVSSEEEARKSGVAIYYYLFDLVYLDGYDTTKVPLRERKSILKAAFPYDRPSALPASPQRGGRRLLP